MSNLPASDKKKKSFHFNLKSFSLRAQYTKKYLFQIIYLKQLLQGNLSNLLLRVFPLQQGGISEEIVALQQRLILLHSLVVNSI